MQIDLSSDLKRLWDEGYDLKVINGHLLVRGVPYLTYDRKVKKGIFVTVLSLNGDVTIKPETHVAYFIGEMPCNLQGQKLSTIIEMEIKPLAEGVVINFTFSAKMDYVDYYHKISAYINIICSPVFEIDPKASAKTFEFFPVEEEESVFNYTDTNSSRAKISSITEKLTKQKIGVIGLGGTGSYLLDFLAKTPVSEIHLLDGDAFLQHNAFRAPGAPAKERFFEHLRKVDYLSGIYSNMHTGIIPHPEYLTVDNLHLLDTLDFVFVSMDGGRDKKLVIDYLCSKQIPFIHTGLGIQEVDTALKGQIKTTAMTNARNNHLDNRISYSDNDDNIYGQNIQISELNALNACFAIIKWKKIKGFYTDLDREQFSSYVLYANEIINDDFPA